MSQAANLRPVELDRIADYPGYWAARVPEREAMVLNETRLTYRQMAEQVDALARARGVRRLCDAQLGWIARAGAKR